MAVAPIPATVYPPFCTRSPAEYTPNTPAYYKCNGTHLSEKFNSIGSAGHYLDFALFRLLLGRERVAGEDIHLTRHPTKNQAHAHLIAGATHINNPNNPTDKKIRFVLLAFRFDFTTRLLTASRGDCEVNVICLKSYVTPASLLPHLRAAIYPEATATHVPDDLLRIIAGYTTGLEEMLHQVVHAKGHELITINNLPENQNDATLSRITVLSGATHEVNLAPGRAPTENLRAPHRISPPYATANDTLQLQFALLADMAAPEPQAAAEPQLAQATPEPLSAPPQLPPAPALDTSSQAASAPVGSAGAPASAASQPQAAAPSTPPPVYAENPPAAPASARGEEKSGWAFCWQEFLNCLEAIWNCICCRYNSF